MDDTDVFRQYFGLSSDCVEMYFKYPKTSLNDFWMATVFKFRFRLDDGQTSIHDDSFDQQKEKNRIPETGSGAVALDLLSQQTRVVAQYKNLRADLVLHDCSV